MIIDQPASQHAEGRVVLSAAVQFDHPRPGDPERLWFSYPAAYAPHISSRSDAFLIAMLPMAMARGEALSVRGDVSPRLLFGARDFQNVYSYWYPEYFRRVAVNAERLTPAPYTPRAAAAAFSGGVDSFYTLWSHQPGQCAVPQMQVRYALMLTRAYAMPHSAAYAGEQQLLDKFAPLLAEIGVDLIEVRSNWRQFRDPQRSFLADYGTELYAAAAGLAPLLHTLYLAQGLSYDDLYRDGTSPVSTPLLRTETLEFYAHGCEAGRIEKLRAMQDWQPALDGVVVCWDVGRADYTRNCGSCPKCLRTRMAIEMAGLTGKVSTMPPAFTARDILAWGRWLETDHIWHWEILKLCWRQHRALLVPVILAVALGLLRGLLKKILPAGLKRIIYRRTTPPAFRHLAEYNQAASTNPSAHNEP
ncbi:MAG: hypothetical protein HPY85_15485 [Anaerolineae bacterium]|nr:hypothetical protein [Anaerolineae bacterium]